jgi:hypothetical protein
MEVPMATSFPAPDPAATFAEGNGEIVEIALLLPKKRAEALVALSARKRQSVGQILRGLIDRALGDGPEPG